MDENLAAIMSFVLLSFLVEKIFVSLDVSFAVFSVVAERLSGKWLAIFVDGFNSFKLSVSFVVVGRAVDKNERLHTEHKRNTD